MSMCLAGLHTAESAVGGCSSGGRVQQATAGGVVRTEQVVIGRARPSEARRRRALQLASRRGFSMLRPVA